MAPSEPARKPGILKTDTTAPAYASSASSASLKDLTASPKSTPKSVSIAPKGELISPLILGDQKDVDELDLDRSRPPRVPRVKGPNHRRMSGRPSAQSSISSLQQWFEDANDMNDSLSSPALSEQQSSHHGFVTQIAKWIKDEKAKRAARHARRHAHHISSAAQKTTQPGEQSGDHEEVDLDQLEMILKESFPFGRRSSRKTSLSGKSRGSARNLHRPSSVAISSDTDFVDHEILVPSTDVVLDNSCTMSYKGGEAQSSDDTTLTRQMTATEDAWLSFKAEVLRIIHTLRLKGWRRVPSDMSPEISISRLSGALTNAVYVVSPPDEIPQTPSTDAQGVLLPMPKRKPPKLLLRIYGPQVEHLIDREVELAILQRLSRKHIGPRLLGTFLNGRFEEFLNAAPLTPEDLRNPDTSRHIAKRMRELHDGVDLLQSERDDGPFVFRNWDKWLARVQTIALWLDERSIASEGEQSATPAKTSFVCGAKWEVFHDILFKYRQWLVKQAGGPKKLAVDLCFAHNDTQYGNILRVIPSATSPLLLPANSHKQLVVIDFEYANSNTRGLEFANHFSEWCYNYHDDNYSWRCNHQLYPTEEDQERFIRAYVRHRPEFNITTPRLDPLKAVPESREISPHHKMTGEEGPQSTKQSYPDRSTAEQDQRTSYFPARPTLADKSSISNFMLDARAPGSNTPNQSSSITSKKQPESSQDAAYAHAENEQIQDLMHQTRIWRMANSAQWVAWGLVQANVPGMPEIGDDGKVKEAQDQPADGQDEDEAKRAHTELSREEKTKADEEIAEDEEQEEEHAEFEYLSYARDRAMLFWGDAVNLGFVKLGDLPEDTQRDIKQLQY